MNGESQSGMLLDVRGRIENTTVPHTHAFLPVFEAVVNSIHAIDDQFSDGAADRGGITVRVARERLLDVETAMGRPLIREISSISITDNGIGFTDDNLDAFKTADTRAKSNRGGKGIGRFTWLVVFERAEIESVWMDGAARRRRSFSFSRTPAGIEDLVDEATADDTETETTITLHTVRSRYAPDMRRGAEAIADRLFEHCFNYFVLGGCPEIVLIDEDVGDAGRMRINDKMDEVVCDDPEPLQIDAHALEVVHTQRKHTSGDKHEAHLCANGRVVESFPLVEHSDLPSQPIHDEDGEAVVHHVFVRGRVLDEAVDSTRTRINLPDDSSLLSAAGALDLKTLRSALGEEVNKRLGAVLEAAQAETFDLVRKHIQTEAPEYRHLLTRRPDELRRVRWTENTAKLDEQLYRIGQDWDAEVRKHQREVESRILEDKGDLAELEEAIVAVVSEVNEQGQANLVRYVVKRRSVLKFLTTLISSATGPASEDRIHSIVFPVRKTGDEISFDDHNLWLVDDRLAFYEVLASDKALVDGEGVPSDSRRRPDILAFRTGDPYQHVALVEFKRADRKNENPAQQLVDYADLLRAGRQERSSRRHDESGSSFRANRWFRSVHSDSGVERSSAEGTWKPNVRRDGRADGSGVRTV